MSVAAVSIESLAGIMCYAGVQGVIPKQTECRICRPNKVTGRDFYCRIVHYRCLMREVPLDHYRRLIACTQLGRCPVEISSNVEPTVLSVSSEYTSASSEVSDSDNSKCDKMFAAHYAKMSLKYDDESKTEGILEESKETNNELQAYDEAFGAIDQIVVELNKVNEFINKSQNLIDDVRDKMSFIQSNFARGALIKRLRDANLQLFYNDPSLYEYELGLLEDEGFDQSTYSGDPPAEEALPTPAAVEEEAVEEEAEEEEADEEEESDEEAMPPNDA